jgi:4-hydroxythreonine-4-phosphate dehydrogenase
MSTEQQKPLIGFTSGDLNGIGIELIIKTLSDNRILEQCTPIVFASNKSINFYRKSLPEINFAYQSVKDFSRINYKQLNVFNCWDDEVAINAGQLNEIGGMYARLSLQQAVNSLKGGQIHGLVTAPLHKKNIQSPEFNFTGHTPYLKHAFGLNDVLMLMVASNLRVALVTEHVPVKDIAANISKENIAGKLKILSESLKIDFGIEKPKIAVLGLNPHAGDEGLVGNEEQTIIRPAISEAKEKGILAFGPFSADAFFARASYQEFDAVLAMYHDQGLIPFKSLAIGEGVNFTAGMPVVRTSPDHGTAFDIAGKGKADPSSFLAAIFECIDIIKRRAVYHENHSNPLRKMSNIIIANATDEAIEVSEDDNEN